MSDSWWYEWDKGHEQFLLHYGKETITMFPRIWFMVDIESFVLMSHGSEEKVKKRWDELQAKLRHNQDPMMLQIADNTVMIDVSDLPLEEIHQCINSAGYIESLWKKYNTQIQRPRGFTESLQLLSTNKRIEISNPLVPKFMAVFDRKPRAFRINYIENYANMGWTVMHKIVER